VGCCDLVNTSGKPNSDLPNQEKNQYWTVYWWETKALYTQGMDQGIIGPLREMQTEIGQDAKNRWDWKPIMAAYLKWTTLEEWKPLTANCLKC